MAAACPFAMVSEMMAVQDDFVLTTAQVKQD
jgi:hypothetical protein